MSETAAPSVDEAPAATVIRGAWLRFRGRNWRVFSNQARSDGMISELVLEDPHESTWIAVRVPFGYRLLQVMGQ